jgi:hypothetical protein
MFSARRCLIASVAAVLAAVLAATPLASGPAQAQGFFDFLFRPPPAKVNIRSYAPSTPGFGGSESPAASAPRMSGTGRHASYCVRLCDGRYSRCSEQMVRNPESSAVRFARRARPRFSPVRTSTTRSPATARAIRASKMRSSIARKSSMAARAMARMLSGSQRSTPRTIRHCEKAT